MGGPKIPSPQPVPTMSAADVEAAANAERTRAADAQGRQATILGDTRQQNSTPGSAPGSGQAMRKSLLGE